MASKRKRSDSKSEGKQKKGKTEDFPADAPNYNRFDKQSVIVTGGASGNKMFDVHFLTVWQGLANPL